MRKFMLFVIMAFAVSMAAQEAHISASYTHNGDLHGGPLQTILNEFKTSNIGGIDGGFSAKVAGPLGLALDLNYSQGGDQVQLLFMGGPEIAARTKNYRLFAHALVGGARLEHKTDFTLQGITASLSDASFAYALGGGVEKYWGHVGIRTGLDYIYTDAFHASEHNLRVTGGLAFRW